MCDLLVTPWEIQIENRFILSFTETKYNEYLSLITKFYVNYDIIMQIYEKMSIFGKKKKLEGTPKY